MEYKPYMDDFNAYKRLVNNFCKCHCPPHCGHSCSDCDNCTECECDDCTRLDLNKGYN